ncbi:MAG: hypothetical protein IIY11_08600 [Clostridia bacterium]|nr:hypothetical protein [Clostridia bacterium]
MAAKNATPVNEEKVTVFVDKESGEPPMLFVGINGKNWQIPRGKSVEVPKSVADMVEARKRMKRFREEYSSRQQELSREIQGAR